MPINKRGLFSPDFEADTLPPWINMGEDQPIDINPAVGAFQKRFMGGNKGDMENVPTPTELPVDMGGPDMGGGQPLKKGFGKSL